MNVSKQFIVTINDSIKKDDIRSTTTTGNGAEAPALSKEAPENLKHLQSLVDESVVKSQTKPPPKIQKVPHILRDRPKSLKYFEPRVVSVGPIHHNKENLQLAESYKLKLAAEFIKKSSKNAEQSYGLVRAKIEDLKTRFKEEVIKDYSDDRLSWILFLDGCAILQFVQYYQNAENLKDFNLKHDHMAFVQHDLFLLENQIPFLVLKLLMNSTNPDFKVGLESAIKHFIRSNIPAPNIPTVDLNLETLDPTHILDLLQQAIVLVQPSKSSNSPSQGKGNTAYSFRTVKELKATGITVEAGESFSLNEVRFSSYFFSSRLVLPPLVVDDSTLPKLLNLVAHESCPDNFKTNYEVTSYVGFLDSLIDHPDDVKELREKKILRNHLGCDEEVALLFNEIAMDLVPNPEIYKDVKSMIQCHYEKKWRRWVAEGSYTHFSSPWTIFAFVAALIALALTGIQTWFGVFPRSHN